MLNNPHQVDCYLLERTPGVFKKQHFGKMATYPVCKWKNQRVVGTIELDATLGICCKIYDVVCLLFFSRFHMCHFIDGRLAMSDAPKLFKHPDDLEIKAPF